MERWDGDFSYTLYFLLSDKNFNFCYFFVFLLLWDGLQPLFICIYSLYSNQVPLPKSTVIPHFRRQPLADPGGGSIDIFPTFRGLFEHFLPRGGTQMPSQMSVTGGGKKYPNITGFQFFWRHPFALPPPLASRGGGSSDIISTFHGLF